MHNNSSISQSHINGDVFDRDDDLDVRRYSPAIDEEVDGEVGHVISTESPTVPLIDHPSSERTSAIF